MCRDVAEAGWYKIQSQHFDTISYKSFAFQGWYMLMLYDAIYLQIHFTYFWHLSHVVGFVSGICHVVIFQLARSWSQWRISNFKNRCLCHRNPKSKWSEIAVKLIQRLKSTLLGYGCYAHGYIQQWHQLFVLHPLAVPVWSWYELLARPAPPPTPKEENRKHTIVG